MVYLILAINFITLIGCKKNKPPGDFEAVLPDCSANQCSYDLISIAWSESRDPENSFIFYDVYYAEDIPNSSYILVKNGISKSSSNQNYNPQ